MTASASNARVGHVRMDRLETSCIRMELALIAGGNGGKLAAGETGWILVSLRNVSEEPITFHTFAFSGKREGAAGLSPSIGGFPGYSGFGIATLSYMWAKDGEPSNWCALAPPDSQIALAPHETKEFVRGIQAPPVSGIYSLRLNLDTKGVTEALRTVNNVIPEERIYLKSVVEGVEVVVPTENTVRP